MTTATHVLVANKLPIFRLRDLLVDVKLTVYAEHGDKSRAYLPLGTRFGTHFLVLDEFHDFVSQSGS